MQMKRAQVAEIKAALNEVVQQKALSQVEFFEGASPRQKRQQLVASTLLFLISLMDPHLFDVFE